MNEPDSETPSGSGEPRVGSVGSKVTRRTYLLGTVGALGFSGYVATSTESARADTLTVELPQEYLDRFDNIVNILDAGADPTGADPIDDILDSTVADDTLVVFPEGRYLMNSQFRETGYENLGFYGDNATLTHGQIDAIENNVVTSGEFTGAARFFRLGVIYAPGKDLLFEGFTFDFVPEQTGIRAIEAYVTDGLEVRDITVVGEHDTGTLGPALFSVTTANGSGVVERFRAPDGAAFTEDTIGDINLGPTGILIDPNSAGTLRLVDCELGRFPDNGLYVSGANGTVHVEGGTYKNSTVTSIRLKGYRSSIRGVDIIIDELVSGISQRGIRLDDGADFLVEDTTVTVTGPAENAIRVLNDAETSTIKNCSIILNDAKGSARGIQLTENAGRVEVLDTTIEVYGSEFAVYLQGNNDSQDSMALLRNVTITGPAPGDSAREAIRVERANGRFENLVVDQPGDNYRRCVEIHADDNLFVGGTYQSTHHPFINKGNRTRFDEVTARSYGGWQAAKLYAEGTDVVVMDSTLYGGYIDKGAEGFVVDNTEMPPA
ncbi:right-handed parallel beta-helix repeat-containing protein [Haloferax larsenii]|uniref:Right handed beta helix region n=1 Tax=Haloferax larsenii TaxID=302484 RepID=A0A1H7V2R7_HALLR|nr:right-handed parallel beta-helix repeat-containing protein [Haloferax larsenii]SEM03460.1 Right handed beta helix region [Haloferax larsenii]